jgi:hypothetical protein
MLLMTLVVLAAGYSKRPGVKTAGSGPVISLADASSYGSSVVGDKATYTYSGSWEAISIILPKSKITGETSMEIVPGMPPRTRTDWFGQDTQNNLYFLGHLRDNTNLQMREDNPKPLYRPSALSVSRTWDCIAWIGKTCEKWSYRVDGIEWLDTPAGRFETYKVAYSFIIDNGR